MFWKNSINNTIETSSKNHIDSVIEKGSEEASSNTHKRIESWDLLHQLNNYVNLLQLCAGDFNEIMRSLEKTGGSDCSQTQMLIFLGLLLTSVDS